MEPKTQPQLKRVDPPPDKLIATATIPPRKTPPRIKEKQGCGFLGFLVFAAIAGAILWLTWTQL